MRKSARVTFKFKGKIDFFRKFEYRNQSGEYSTFNIKYQYGGDSKFKLRNKMFEKHEYLISIWLIFDIQM